MSPGMPPVTTSSPEGSHSWGRGNPRTLSWSLCPQGAERKIRDEERKQSKRKGKCGALGAVSVCRGRVAFWSAVGLRPGGPQLLTPEPPALQKSRWCLGEGTGSISRWWSFPTIAACRIC